ncbi:MAG: NAD-dependent epimerase/dehydratase family protein [Pseudomonadota bacterium]
MFAGKKVLVTGGSGMIGRELVNMLLAENAEVHVADLSEPLNMSPKIKFSKVDLKEFASCRQVCAGMDYVFNLVGIKCSPKVCLEQPADIMGPMMQFNTNMLDAAMQAGAKWYLYTSTVGVYQPAEVLYEDDVWTTQPSRNDWFGGWAKRMGELQCQAYEKQYGEGKCSIVRPANVYGPYDNFNPANAMVVPSLIRKAAENEVLEVWGDGSAIRDFIHARDVARGMMHMVKNKITQPVNLGSGTGITIKQVAEAVAKKFNKPIKWLTDKPTGDAKRLFDMSRAKSLGFEPQISIEQGIDETVQWFLENREIIDKRYNVFDKK